jgi:molybdopterin-guanine dinucleotide biosynthesis protein A
MLTNYNHRTTLPVVGEVARMGTEPSGAARALFENESHISYYLYLSDSYVTYLTTSELPDRASRLSPPERASITGAVLCGGAGRRAGGIDKPLIEWRGHTLVHTVVQRLAPQVARILISANRNLDAYRALAATVTDRLGTYQGPLAGIDACLATCRDPWLFVCPGDTPELSRNLVARLAYAIGDAPVAVAHDGTRTQHLHMLIRCDAVRPDLDATLARGERSVHRWLGSRACEVDCADIAASFANFNTPADLEEAP